ncbi:MAG: ComF family protein [Rhizobiaceae bacterium]|nr:ComF family protein [Rhizobiaceae bacterium]MCV0408349.1 ComF family protein [Rhizobiaceae bacterium]
MAGSAAMFKTAVNAGVSGVRRAMFPPLCLGCRRMTARPGTMCARCWAKLAFVERPWCAVTGLPFDHDHGEGFVSAGAIADPPPYDRARAALVYAGLARRLAQDLKYNDRTDLAPWMAGWMARAGAEFLGEVDLIVPVPLHRWRFLGRRFNQSAELARHLAPRFDVPCRPDVVVRTRRTRQQVGLGIRARQDNVRGAFHVPDAMRPRVKGKRVLLVDDVLTTGATVSALARTLRRAGAAGIDVLTFARVVPGFGDDEAERDFDGGSRRPI